MSQSHIHSVTETVVSTSVGFIVSLALTYYVLPLFGFHPSPAKALAITLIHTVASLLRGYVIRRVFNARNHG